MRVLHVVPSLAASRGGPTAVVLALAPALARLGVEVEVIASTAGSTPRELDAIRESLQPMRVTLVPTIGTARFELAPTLMGVLARALSRCDVVHLHTVFTFPLAAAAHGARRARVPYVVRPAGTLDEICLRSRSYWLKRLALRTWVGGMLDHAAAVQATSTLEARELAAWVAPDRIVEVELGGDAVDVPPDDGRAGTRLLSIGRVHPMKGLERIIDALALLPRNVSLTLGGSGDARYVASLQRRVQRLGVDVRFVGALAGEAKTRALAEATLCVFPSHHESYGIALVEALAAGRAAVLTDAVGVAPVLRAASAGRVVAGDPASLAAAIRELLDDGVERRQLAVAGLELARSRYSWDAAAARTAALYERVVRVTGVAG